MAEGDSSTAPTIDPPHSQGFMTFLLSDFEKQEDCDIFFSVDGNPIGAHRMVLKVTSRGLYELGTQETRPIEIKSMDFDTFKSLLR